MIIDIHTHTFPEKIASATIAKLEQMSHTRAFTDGTTEALANAMERAGIDRAVVLPVATNDRQVVRVNDASIRLTETYESRGVLSFGCMHPTFEGWKEELDRIAEQGLKGIKIHPVYQNVDLDDVRFLRILDRCGQLGLTVVTHAGIDIGYPEKVNCSPAMARRAVQQVGPVKLVLAHMGGWRNWDEVEDLLADTSVYLDTSFSVGKIADLGDGYYRPEELDMLAPEEFARLVKTFGASRVLFGTDSPWDNYENALSFIRGLPVTVAERAAILGGNARRLLGLV